jgi:thiol-disulfide isomerase/thioredoxin
MRFTVAFVLALGLVGCGQHVDPTMNQQMNQAADYPPGPYGYVTGSVIQNIDFVGKNATGDTTATDYRTLPMQNVSLADFHNDPSVKYVVLSGVAGWCGPCNDEQKQVPTLQATYQPKGFRFFEAMIQGYNEMSGAPATETDLNEWQSVHTITVGLGLDPEDKIHQYADIAAFPLNMVVRTSDMQIVHMQVGEESLDSVLSSLP